MNADCPYRLSPLGQALGAAIAPLDQWARAWASQTAEPPEPP